MTIPTLNLTYIVAAPLTADIVGPAIKVKKDGRVTIFLQVPSISGAPNGLWSLQGRLDVSDVNGWKDLTNAFSELPGQGVTGLLAVWDKPCVFSGVNAEEVRLKYTRFSGGTGNVASAQYRAR